MTPKCALISQNIAQYENYRIKAFYDLLIPSNFNTSLMYKYVFLPTYYCWRMNCIFFCFHIICAWTHIWVCTRQIMSKRVRKKIINFLWVTFVVKDIIGMHAYAGTSFPWSTNFCCFWNGDKRRQVLYDKLNFLYVL